MKTPPSLILATGSNLLEREANLTQAKKILSGLFSLKAESQVYESEPVDNTQQPSFLNQVLEFQLPDQNPLEVLSLLKEIEVKMGTIQKINKGPRIIDIDIIFWGLEKYNFPQLKIPHPSWHERAFVIYPLSELPFFSIIKEHFPVEKNFLSKAWPYRPS